jgi:hypothetical protein
MKLKNSPKKQEKRQELLFLFNDATLHKDSGFGKYVAKNVRWTEPWIKPASNISAGLPVKGG